MNIRRILISEQEKKEILSKYGVNNDILSEGFDKTNGIYTTETGQILKKVTNPKDITIPAGTKAWHNFKGSDTKINLGNTGVYYDCAFDGYENIFVYGETFGTLKNDPLSKRLREFFCNGKKMKTWEEATGQQKKEGETKKKCVFINKEFTQNQVCYLTGDKTWVYAKSDDGKWFTSKQVDKKTWCELTPDKYQKAIDTLVAGCKSTEPVVELKPKGIGNLDVASVDKTKTELDIETQEVDDINGI